MANPVITIQDALAEAAAGLPDRETARLDAEVLLAAALGCNRAYLFAWPERSLTPEERVRFDDLMLRRAGGEPVAYLLGHREFWSLDLAVTTATLIPRPDTEQLVEAALERIPREAASTVADLGTGSGAIALAIARERPDSRVSAVDRSESALAVARANAVRLGIGNIEFFAGSWFEPLAGRRFSVVVSNPPYIAEDDPHLKVGDVRFEPRAALVAGHDGLAAIRSIVAAAPQHLEVGGWLVLEHGFDQAAAVRDRMENTGFADLFTLRDLAGRDRVSGGRFGS